MRQEQDGWAPRRWEDRPRAAIAPFPSGAARAQTLARVDRAAQTERALGLALWLLFVVVLLGLS